MATSQTQARIKKPPVLSNIQGPMPNNIAPRESTPSPSFRERQRAIKMHSMPIVPSVSQVLAGGVNQSPPQPSPTSSTVSHQARRSPPAATRISPVAPKLASTTLMATNGHGDRTPDRVGSPPPLLHSQSTPLVPQLGSSPPAQAHQPRPLNRVAPPPFLSQYSMDGGWHVTEELLAEIERADQAQGQLEGRAGVAYAGGAASGSLHMQRDIVATAKDPAVERVRAGERSSPKDEMKRNSRELKIEQSARESPKNRDRSQTMSSTASQSQDPQSAQRSPEFRGSPPFVTPMTTPGERTAAYAQYIPDSYQTPAQASGSSVRKVSQPTSADSSSTRSTPTSTTKISSHTPPAQMASTRQTDRALPLQEEPEEDVAHDFLSHEPEYEERHHGSPTPSSDLYPEGKPSTRYDSRHVGSVQHTEDDEDEDTLNEEMHSIASKSEDEDPGFTPRSPSTTLPERPRDGGYSPNGSYIPATVQYSQTSADNQKTIRGAKHGRAGSTDQMGIRSLDSSLFDPSPSNRQETTSTGSQTQPAARSPPATATQPKPPQPPLLQTYPTISTYPIPGRPVQQSAYGQTTQVPLSPHFEDLQGIFDNPTSSYLQAFLQSPVTATRPGAPIPPTPHSYTVAPSPAPLSAVPSELEPRQIGSPYPYPFTHIRRTALSAAQNAPSSTYDPNNPAAVREQLALQMQIYALNNGLAAPSDSTFSPAATPFPGHGYNPWAFLQQPARPGDSSMSMRSSPSHEPVPMPVMPPIRGRNLRHKDNSGNLRIQASRRRMKVPPRVESTQPRETSPEPSSSGEETAGEDRYVNQYLNEASGEGNWRDTNGTSHDGDRTTQVDDSEWVDEDEEEQEDLLQLEFHPSYINSTEKRRRRWETRWDALTQAVQALDRETDATVVVFAAPSHSHKLHSLLSRSIRRSPSMRDSPRLAKMKSNFSQLAAERRAARSRKVSLIEMLSSSRAGSTDGSTPGESREEDLRRALEAALGSLNALGTIYEQREARWKDEMRRLSDDRERVQLLLGQALGQLTVNGHEAEPSLLS